MEDLKSNVTASQQHASVTDIDVLKTQVEATFDTKIKTALAMTSRPAFNSESSYYKPILESEAIQDRTYQESQTPKDTGAGVGR